MLLKSLDAAHQMILRHEAGLTTLCIAFVCPLQSTGCHAVCVVSVGDSLAYVLSRHHGLREVTTGSRDVSCERDIRDAGGALGPVRNGCDPELHNLTLSMTLVDPGDIVFLTTDGISDNFDPVITKIAVPLATLADMQDEGTDEAAEAVDDDVDDDDDDRGHSSGDLGQRSPSDQPLTTQTEISSDLDQRSYDDQPPSTQPESHDHDEDNRGQGSSDRDCDRGQRSRDGQQVSGDGGQRSNDGRPLMTPAERHMYAVKEMERVVHEFELFAECSCSAQELTGIIVQHVLKLTDVKRKVRRPVFSPSVCLLVSFCLSLN